MMGNVPTVSNLWTHLGRIYCHRSNASFSIGSSIVDCHLSSFLIPRNLLCASLDVIVLRGSSVNHFKNISKFWKERR
jgi:hypothetical protein